MKFWHLTTQSGRYAACEMPPWMSAGCVCEHTSRASARKKVQRLEAAGLHPPRIVAGACPAQEKRRRAAVCEKAGANVYGRIDAFISAAERDDVPAARAELLALLKFFPATERKP